MTYTEVDEVISHTFTFTGPLRIINLYAAN